MALSQMGQDLEKQSGQLIPSVQTGPQIEGPSAFVTGPSAPRRAASRKPALQIATPVEVCQGRKQDDGPAELG